MVFVVTVRPDIAVPEGSSGRFDGLRLVVGGFAAIGAIEAVSWTIPLKPLRLVSVIVDRPPFPAAKGSDSGFAEIVKSITLTVTLTVFRREPLVPVTVMV